MRHFKRVELSASSVQIAVLTPATEMPFRHPPRLIAIDHQQRPIIIDTVILIVSTQLGVKRTESA